MTLACPECDSADNLYRRTGRNSPEVTPSQRWRCGECGAEFRTPNERPGRSSAAPNRSTLARALLNANPEDVTGVTTDG